MKFKLKSLAFFPVANVRLSIVRSHCVYIALPWWWALLLPSILTLHVPVKYSMDSVGLPTETARLAGHHPASASARAVEAELTGRMGRKFDWVENQPSCE